MTGFRAGLAMLAVVSFAAFTTGCASTDASGTYSQAHDFSQIERVAISGISGAGNQEAAQEQVGAMFTQQLMELGYRPIERTRVRAVMEEQNFAQSDSTTSDGAARLGRILNVDAMIVVDVPEYGDDMSMSARMIDPETAEVIWTASGSGDMGMAARAGTFIGGITGGLIGHEYGGAIGTLGGAAAGAAAGDLTGRQMTPREQELAAELIIEITETLPSRR